MFIHDNVLKRERRPGPVRADFIEAGSGPVVMLVHSSMAGAKQWAALVPELETDFHVRAVNLFGYGATPAWPGTTRPSLDDYADLVAAAIPNWARDVTLVGHSFGGAVAMRVAQRERGRIGNLVLLEPSLFGLLQSSGRHEALAELHDLAHDTVHWIANCVPEAAAETFIDYWCGAGAWAAMPEPKRAAILANIAHLPREWSAVLEDEIDVATLQRSLPSQALLMWFENTARPSREVAEVITASFPCWLVAMIGHAGHMGPVTHANLVNPIIRDFLLSSMTDRKAA